MTPPRGDCQLCGKPVRNTDQAGFRVMGFEIERSEGGANQIVGREREPNTIYHAVCIRRFVKSPGGTQLALGNG